MSQNNYPSTGDLGPVERGSVLIRNVRPYGEGEPVNILIEDGLIADMDAADDANADTVIDAKGMVLLPGLVDLHGGHGNHCHRFGRCRQGWFYRRVHHGQHHACHGSAGDCGVGVV